MMGFAGVYFLPLLFSLVCLLCTALLIRVLNGEESVSTGVLLLGLCTPFLFYSITFWEHTFAVALTTGALLLIVAPPHASPRRHLIAGMLVGLSTIFREEGYIYFPALALSVLLVSPPGSVRANRFPCFLHLLAGWLIFVLPLWIFQQQLYGHFLGAHAVMNPSPLLDFFRTFKPEYLTHVLSNFFVFLFEYHPDSVFKVVLVIPHILLVLSGLFYPQKKLIIALILTAGVTNAILLIEMVRNPQPVWNTLFTQGLVPGVAFSLIAFSFLGSFLSKADYAARFLASLLLLYLAGSCLNLNQNVFGIIWGPRHFLPVMPVLAALAVLALRRVRSEPLWAGHRKLFLPAAAALVAVSLCAQIFGLFTMHVKRDASARLREAVLKSKPQAVVTDAYWVPEELSTLFFEMPFYQVDSPSELHDLLLRLKEGEVNEFLFLASKKYRKLPETSASLLLKMSIQRELLIFPKAELLDTALLFCSLDRWDPSPVNASDDPSEQRN